MKTLPARSSAVLAILLWSSIGAVVAQPITGSSAGTKFSFASTDRWKKETDRWELEVLDRKGDLTSIRHAGLNETVTYTIAGNGEVTREKPTTSDVWTYKPVPFPLEEGAEWEWIFYYVSPTQRILSRVSRNCKAGAVEEITVPAGRFNARKFECKGSWQSGSFSGMSRRTGWFSPDLNVAVRLEDETSGGYGTDLSVTQLLQVRRP